MDEVFFVIGTVQTRGRYLEFWVEGWTTDSDRAELYADRLNAIHDESDDPESIRYLVLSAFALEGSDFADDLEYDA